MSLMRELFSDEKGKLSSTRFLGAVAAVVGIVCSASGKAVAGSQLLTFAATLLGVGQIKSAVITTQSGLTISSHSSSSKPKQDETKTKKTGLKLDKNTPK